MPGLVFLSSAVFLQLVVIFSHFERPGIAHQGHMDFSDGPRGNSGQVRPRGVGVNQPPRGTGYLQGRDLLGVGGQMSCIDRVCGQESGTGGPSAIACICRYLFQRRPI